MITRLSTIYSATGDTYSDDARRLMRCAVYRDAPLTVRSKLPGAVALVSRLESLASESGAPDSKKEGRGWTSVSMICSLCRLSLSV